MAQLNSASVKSYRGVARPNLIFRLIAQRLVGSIITLLVIAYLTLVGLLLAERGRQHLPANALDALRQAAVSLVLYVTNHPSVYHWSHQVVPARELLGTILTRSIVLLLGSIGIAFFLGLALGINAAVSKRKISSGILTILSVLGVSTPSFLLAMLFWVLNIQYYKITGNPALPSAGFGWDAHIIMPVLVLAMRPMAQIAQVAYVTFSDVLRQDYIRTAEAKGLSKRVVRNRHALRNLLIPIFTTVGTSLRFSLASLPVVELFFNWPGVGSALIEAIDLGETALILDLLLSLGLFFLLVNLIIEIFFPVLDPRLREDKAEEVLEEHNSFLGWWRGIFEILRAWIRNIRRRRRSDNDEKLPSLGHIEKAAEKVDENEVMHSRRKWFVRNLLTNPSLIVGFLLTIGLLVIVFFGSTFASADPYKTNGVMLINGEIFAPPFKPSSIFPWGSDYVGRDIQSLVLNGARQTLSLAFFGMLARLLIGVTLGALAGWQRGGWLDRWMMGAVGVWAAFPITLFAMILIQGLGIQHGMWVFVVAISIVGWGEVAQFVRGQVTAIKPLSYIESARSIGARSDQIMSRHVIPNLINTLLVLAVLEMGGILMLLAELGYLNIFMGGGFRAAIGEVGAMQPVVVYFSDVPEWAALIANVRQWWRSYPWMALYPGLAFFLSILAFNLFGEGLRRFLEDSQVNLSRLFNRYTFSALVGTVVILSLVLQGASPMSIYRPDGMKFKSENVLRDIEALTQPNLQGRETGTPGAEMAAEYIAARMKDSGLLPAGEHGTFFQRTPTPRLHLTQTPVLELLDASGTPATAFAYRKDFAEIATGFAHGDVQAEIMGLAFGVRIESTKGGDPYGLMNTDARDRIVIVRAADLPNVNRGAVNGILVVEDETFRVERKDLFPAEGGLRQPHFVIPIMTIKRELAEMLLATAGSGLDDLDAMASTAPAGGVLMTRPGAKVHMSVMPEVVEDLTSEDYINVIGVMPGTGAVEGLDSQVIMVSAYYDGLGVGTDGTIYPGANDNASGVATLFELARLLKESSYEPEKTIIFVAWAGGERNEGLSVVNIMNGRPGGNSLTVTEVIELSGVGYGSGEGIALGEDSSYRLVQLFQKVAGKYHISTTTRGRGPHYGREARPGFGERKALTLSLSWDGADALAHTPGDTFEMIDPQKLYDVGRTTLLTLLVLSRETDY